MSAVCNSCCVDMSACILWAAVQPCNTAGIATAARHVATAARHVATAARHVATAKQHEQPAPLLTWVSSGWKAVAIRWLSRTATITLLCCCAAASSGVSVYSASTSTPARMGRENSCNRSVLRLSFEAAAIALHSQPS